MLDEAYSESHGIFQRATPATPSDQRLTRQQRLNAPPPASYVPKHVTNAYFLASTESDISSPSRFSQTHLLYTLTFHYMRKEYRECVKVGEQLIEQLAPKANLEIYETCARAYIQLGDYKRALELMAFSIMRADPNQNVLLAKLQRLNGLFKDSLVMLRKYCKVRSEDSYAWAEIAQVLIDVAAVNESENRREQGHASARENEELVNDRDGGNGVFMVECDVVKIRMCAERCMHYALHLLTRYQPATPFTLRVTSTRVSALQLRHLNLSCYKAAVFHVDATSGSEVLNEIVEWISRATVKIDTVYVETVEAVAINE